MNNNDIAIATITLARDEKEEQLLRKSLQQLAELKLPVFITDGGSLDGFLDFLRSFPHFNLSVEKVSGVWQQAKNSLFEAHTSQRPFILYTEPDKYDFFRQSLPNLLDSFQSNDKTGVVTASRSESGFATFPTFQRMTETAINNCCAELVGKNLDYTYGPFLLNRKLVPYLKEVKDDIGWGWRPYIFCIARRLGYQVEAYIDNFFCTADQQEDTSAERMYRMKQLKQNIEGMILSTTVRLDGE
ncbi:MAG: hypothetical protein ACR2KZ_02070 [Segetibacter sp.]